ncbi:MAG: hypothetical protein IT294_09760 [Deltaproteobacteria bacterium]|nr:hypothetical protein [Deltaproteobacteria bacterium]
MTKLALRAAPCLAALCIATTAIAAGDIDASNSTVTCSTFLKTVFKPKPTLIVGGTQPATVSIKGKLGTCTTNAPGVTSITGSFKGTLTMLNDCSGFGAATGTITFKWKASPALIDSVSTVTVNAGSAVPNLFMLGSAAYGQLQLGNPPGAAVSVSGSFTGGDGGATSAGNFIFSQDQNTFIALCGGTGIKELNIGVGTITLQ